jgi:hypothetical protein
MSRFSTVVESQAGQLAGAPSGTTFNGYFAALVAGASQNLRLRRAKLGVRTTSAVVPTSQQYSVKINTQTVRPTSTGFSTQVGTNLDPRGAASQVTGVDITTAATANTTGPTLTGTTGFDGVTLNTQSSLDTPWDLIEEMYCDQGTANGLAFVNIGVALPANHLFVLTLTWEE